MFLNKIAQEIRDSLPPATSVPHDSGDLFLMYALLASAKGTDTTMEDIHNAWCLWQLHQDPSHPALVPFDELPDEAKLKDAPFLSATLAVASHLGAKS